MRTEAKKSVTYEQRLLLAVRFLLFELALQPKPAGSSIRRGSDPRSPVFWLAEDPVTLPQLCQNHLHLPVLNGKSKRFRSAKAVGFIQLVPLSDP